MSSEWQTKLASDVYCASKAKNQSQTIGMKILLGMPWQNIKNIYKCNGVPNVSSRLCG